MYLDSTFITPPPIVNSRLLPDSGSTESGPSPMSVRNGACPGRIPTHPSQAGATRDRASPSKTTFSGVTTLSRIDFSTVTTRSTVTCTVSGNSRFAALAMRQASTPISRAASIT